MKEKIKAFAKTLQIEFTGIAPAEPMNELREILQDRRRTFGLPAFEEPDLEKRTVPERTLPGAKSIVVCLFPYYSEHCAAQNLAKFAQIPDYHTVVMERLKKLCGFIKELFPKANLAPFVDTGPLADKYLAFQAGLGFFGKNTLLINEIYGSYVFVGYIVTNLPLEPDTPSDKTCMGCGKCLALCPGRALSGGGLNAFRCVSYITQLKEADAKQKKILSAQQSVYGCDVCQEVCPHNQDIPQTPIDEWKQPKLTSLEQEKISAMSKREFKRIYKEYPFSWRGKDALLKNFEK
ncbi:MAG: tRNA epoxyqueuosine(34) reductase QueG [Clostridiales bacterium]|nr:tRNA epoxyqueuosine(34) reductase QueG [Clostridiales bacterium]